MLRGIYRYWNRTMIAYQRIVAMRSPFSSNIYLMRYPIRYDKGGRKLYKIPRYRYIVDVRKRGGTI